MSSTKDTKKSTSSSTSTTRPVVPPELDAILKHRLVILSCKRFVEQMRDKGNRLTFAERTACNLLLDSIERLGYK